MKRLLQPNTLLCFSPAIMVATICIELGLAGWVLARYTFGRSHRLIIALLILLAGFQLAEFQVCGSLLPSDTATIWSRIGYIFITLLPPLGIHLITQIRHESRRLLVRSCYLLAALFIAAFAFVPTAFNTPVCTGNYVIFILQAPISALYILYYFGLEFIGVALALTPMRKAPASRQAAAHWMAIGYLAFIIPTAILVAILPATRSGLPSIMCGFAVIFALITGLKVAPLLKKA